MTSINRSTMVHAAQERKRDPIPKITKAKRTGGVAGVVIELLSSKCMILSPTTSTTKIIKIKNKFLLLF
jgi:hypothetical protein